MSRCESTGILIAGTGDCHSMPNESYRPGPDERTVRTPQGKVLAVPDDWALLPPGDAALTRRVKLAGPHFVLQEPRGRKLFSRGVWAPAATITRIQADLVAERSTEQFAKRQVSAVKRREKVQTAYVEDFTQAIVEWLAFHPDHADLARRLAVAVAAHATPVGSGTVARTQRIPIEERAASAVIAWMRHQTTAYDSLSIPRQKGARREVRRRLAQRSKDLLACYRRGEPLPATCPLQQALSPTQKDAP